eukprot:GHVQ01004596.1.p2 GENE.GHVQ01004596.1~~GHVQ01004596.1.p2  ORF type:complete len:105 (+),score=0.94 GHVQ01004596.1:107-421(+)
MGILYDALHSLDEILLFVILVSIISFVWKFRDRLAFMILGDSRLRADQYDFFRFLCLCGQVEKWIPSVVPGRTIPVKILKIECINLPGQDLFGGTQAFVQVCTL